MNQQSLVPKRKVSAAGLGGAVSIIVVALIGNVAPEVASAITTVCSFAAGYLVPE